MKYVALDIETTGLYPVKGKDKIFCVTTNDGKSIRLFENAERVRELCEDESICKVIHNAAFDSFWLKVLYNIEVKNIWDTKLMEQVLIGDNLFKEEGATEAQKLELSSSLEYTLKRYKLPVHEKSIGKNFSTRSHTAPLTRAEIEYAKADVEYLLHIQALQQIRLIKLDLMRVATLENKVVEVVVRMRNSGMGLDVKQWNKIESDKIARKNQILKRLPTQVSNWNSPAQAKKYFTSIGIPVLSLGDINDAFVKKYNNDVLNKFVEMRELSTQISKYGKNFLYAKDGRYLVDGDGRVRADFYQILNTGRFSCSKPPLHGLPNEWQEYRGAIVPRKGYVFVGGDFKSQELGIMAAASGEQLWIKALLRGEDPLSLMASMMFKDWRETTEKGCTFPKKCKCKQHKIFRQNSKEITYGIAYGAYAKSISIKIDRTVNETQKLIYRFSTAAPKLSRWLNNNAKQSIMTRTSFSADVYKRRRTIRDPQEWQVRNVGFNNPVQASGANMIKLAMISLDKKWNQVFPWHDDLILEIKKSEAKKAAKELKIVMEKAADYCTGIPGLIKVDPRITKTLIKDE